jgi:hypothetical protein
MDVFEAYDAIIDWGQKLEQREYAKLPPVRKPTLAERLFEGLTKKDLVLEDIHRRREIRYNVKKYTDWLLNILYNNGPEAIEKFFKNLEKNNEEVNYALDCLRLI